MYGPEDYLFSKSPNLLSRDTQLPAKLRKKSDIAHILLWNYYGQFGENCGFVLQKRCLVIVKLLIIRLFIILSVS